MHVTACILEVGVPGSRSLKEKRGRILPVLAALRSRFGLAAAEIGRLDSRDTACLACVAVSNDPAHNERVLRSALRWVEEHRPDVDIREVRFEPR
jgi:uncharacterized protein YlxP (DUF503 family)